MRLIAAYLAILVLAGCSGLLSKPTALPSAHSLDRAAVLTPVAPRLETAPTLIVNPPHAAAGFDSKHMVYSRQAHKLEYFARHEWVDTPARMLAPLMIAAIEASGAFRAVVLTPSAASGDMMLDTAIVHFAQDFSGTPSRLRVTLHAVLVDSATRRVLASREFDVVVAAGSDGPEGGVVAANRAVQDVLAQLADFCAATVRQ